MQMNISKVTERVTYCGVNDRTSALFEGLWTLGNGVTYNSYIVRGSDACAIIDGCEAGHSSVYVNKILKALDGRSPQYVVVNHVEPDHSGALPMLRTVFPDIKFVGNAKTLDMLRGFYGFSDGLIEIHDGDTISLGDRTLSFILTPMVHWPETMMTFLKEEGVLFSADAFGCFGALSGAVTDDEMDATRFFPEAYRYYACIVAKYGVFVQKAIEKCAAIDIKYICSTHGPVWHSHVADIVDIYSKMALWHGENGVVIAYGSMYGNTAAMAEQLAARLAEAGVRKIRMYDLSHSDISFVLADIMRFKAVVLASPTYNGGVYPPVETFAIALTERGITNRAVGVMGSYTWGAAAARKLTEMFSKTKATVLESQVQMKQHLIDEVSDSIGSLAGQIVEYLNK